MQLYDSVVEGLFIDRPNRFIARVLLPGREEICHVKNTGRCKELLVPGARIILARSANPARRTAYDLVAVYKGETLINMDSQAPNRAAAEALPRLFPGVSAIKPESVVGQSRLDFSMELAGRPAYVEVKGVTLEEDGLALFPDAPTERGVKHLYELIACRQAGYAAAALFVIQMRGVRAFSPNGRTDPKFCEALIKARDAGVQLLAYDCAVTQDSMTLCAPVPIWLD